MEQILLILIVLCILLSGVSYLIMRLQVFLFKRFKVLGIVTSVLCELFLTMSILDYVWDIALNNEYDLKDASLSGLESLADSVSAIVLTITLVLLNISSIVSAIAITNGTVNTK